MSNSDLDDTIARAAFTNLREATGRGCPHWRIVVYVAGLDPREDLANQVAQARSRARQADSLVPSQEDLARGADFVCSVVRCLQEGDSTRVAQLLSTQVWPGVAIVTTELELARELHVRRSLGDFEVDTAIVDPAKCIAECRILPRRWHLRALRNAGA